MPPKNATPASVIDQIQFLYQRGVTMARIAEATGVSVSTVRLYREYTPPRAKPRRDDRCLSKATIAEVERLYIDDVPFSDIMRKTGISQSSISNIVRESEPCKEHRYRTRPRFQRLREIAGEHGKKQRANSPVWPPKPKIDPMVSRMQMSAYIHIENGECDAEIVRLSKHASIEAARDGARAIAGRLGLVWPPIKHKTQPIAQKQPEK